MKNTENEGITNQQPPNYKEEIITTLIAIGMVILFFIVTNIDHKNIFSAIFLMIWMSFQLLATGLLFIFAIISWIINSQTLKTFFRILSIMIAAIFLFFLFIGLSLNVKL